MTKKVDMVLGQYFTNRQENVYLYHFLVQCRDYSIANEIWRNRLKSFEIKRFSFLGQIASGNENPFSFISKHIDDRGFAMIRKR